MNESTMLFLFVGLPMGYLITMIFLGINPDYPKRVRWSWLMLLMIGIAGAVVFPLGFWDLVKRYYQNHGIPSTDPLKMFVFFSQVDTATVIIFAMLLLMATIFIFCSTHAIFKTGENKK